MELGRLLCVNANCGPHQTKPERHVIDEALAELVAAHSAGLIMVQEYRFKAGSSFSKFSPLRDLLPGGWRRWKVAHCEFEGVVGMVPLILWDDTLYDGTSIKLAPTASPAPTPGRTRPAAPHEEPFAGRYSAALLTCRGGAGKEMGAKFLAVSYHGQFLESRDSQQELPEEWKQANAQAFLSLVGAAAVRHGVPALVGGDWSTCFVEGRAAPESEEWAVQLRHVARYHPTELDCYRYRSGMPPVDFLAVVAPTERGVTLEAAGVTALSHPAEVQEFFDHDPLLASFSISAGLDAVIPPAPLETGAASVPTPRPPTARKKRATTPREQMGRLTHQDAQLAQQLAWLQQEASMGSGLGEGEELSPGGLGKLGGLGVEGSGSCGYTSSGEAAGAADAPNEEWHGLANSLVAELTLVKQTAAAVLQQRDELIASLQAKLRLIADEAEAGAALPAAEPVPAVLLGGAAGGKGLGARATAALDHASPLTPEPSPKPNSSSVAGAWRSDAESTNGR